MKLNCSKCSGLPQGSYLFVEDGVECPICGGGEEEDIGGKILGGGPRKDPDLDLDEKMSGVGSK